VWKAEACVMVMVGRVKRWAVAVVVVGVESGMRAMRRDTKDRWSIERGGEATKLYVRVYKHYLVLLTLFVHFSSLLQHRCF